jgi:hypothetical protein
MRVLISIPVIHTQQDMGSLLEQIKRDYIAKYSQQKWVEHIKSVDQIWVGIEQLIAELDLIYGDVRLYQDGLPVCGKELEIVTDVAAAGSKNHQLLLALHTQGAQLVGTEDPQLLLQEYQFLQQTLDTSLTPEQKSQLQEQSRKLLGARDKFIGERITETLAAGNIGILLIGMAHCIEPFLAADILVMHLLPTPNVTPC